MSDKPITPPTPEQIAAWNKQQAAIKEQHMKEFNAKLGALMEEYKITFAPVAEIVEGRIVANLRLIAQ